MDREIDELIRKIETGDLSEVRYILQKDTGLSAATAYYRDHRGDPLFHYSIPKNGTLDFEMTSALLKMFLEAGADIDAAGNPPNNEGGTLLIHAAWLGNTPLVEYLLERGASPELGKTRGERAIDTAARHGNKEAVLAFIEGESDYSLTHTIQADLIEQASGLHAEPIANKSTG